MLGLGVLLGQLPSMLISIAACVVAVVVIKGPGRWLALGGILTWVVSSIMMLALPAVDDTLRQALAVVNLLLGLIGYGLLAAAVIVGRFWVARQPPAAAVPQWPVTQD